MEMVNSLALCPVLLGFRRRVSSVHFMFIFLGIMRNCSAANPLSIRAEPFTKFTHLIEYSILL